MTDKKYQLRGIYLVIDPAMEQETLFSKLKESLEAGVNMVQIWSHWPPSSSREDQLRLIKDIITITLPFDVPVLINEEWQWLLHTDLHGVHFDTLPKEWEKIKKEIRQRAIIGLTCGNKPELIQWAEEHAIDYISFCAMFPSSSVDTCELVRPESVVEARKITQMPIFLSGGIQPGNINQLSTLDFQGVAVISGIMKAASVAQSIRAYQKALEQIKKGKR